MLVLALASAGVAPFLSGLEAEASLSQLLLTSLVF